MTIYCRHCGEEIIGCRGIHGDWMHVKGGWEHCTDVHTDNGEREQRVTLACPT